MTQYHVTFIYLLPDVVKMNRSFVADHPTLLRATISSSYDVLGESPDMRCSNTGTFSLSTVTRSFQSDTGSTVSFTVPRTITWQLQHRHTLNNHELAALTVVVAIILRIFSYINVLHLQYADHRSTVVNWKNDLYVNCTNYTIMLC